MSGGGFQHLGGRGRQISVNLRPAWCTEFQDCQRNTVWKNKNKKQTNKQTKPSNSNNKTYMT